MAEYKRQGTNKYYGAGSAGYVSSGSSVDGLAKSLTNAGYKIGKAEELRIDRKKDTAIAKIDEMYATGKSFETIQAEIISGKHPELTGKYIDATTNYHAGKVKAHEVITAIIQGKKDNQYDIRDESTNLDMFYKQYMPDTKAMDSATLLGFTTHFNKFKSKDAIADADARGEWNSEKKVMEGTGLLSDIPIDTLKKDLPDFLESLQIEMPSRDGTMSTLLYTNAETLSVVKRSAIDIISSAKTEADLDRADILLNTNLGYTKNGTAIGTLLSRKSKEVLAIREALEKKRRALVINDRQEASYQEKENVKDLYASVFEKVQVESSTADMKGADMPMRDKNYSELMEIRDEFEKLGVPAFLQNFDNMLDNNRFIDTDPAVYDQLVSDIFDGIYENQEEIADAINQLNLDPKLLSSTLVLFDKWEKDFNKNRGNIHETNSIYKNGIGYIEKAVKGNFTNQMGVLKDNGNQAIRNAHNYMKREIFNFENNWDTSKNGTITDPDRDAFLQKLGDTVIKYYSTDFGVNPVMKSMPEYELEILEQERERLVKQKLYEETGVTNLQTSLKDFLETNELEIAALRDKVASGFDDGIFFSDTDFFDLDSTDKQQYIDKNIVPEMKKMFKGLPITQEAITAMEQQDFDAMKQNIAEALGGLISIEQIDMALKSLVTNGGN